MTLNAKHGCLVVAATLAALIVNPVDAQVRTPGQPPGSAQNQSNQQQGPQQRPIQRQPVQGNGQAQRPLAAPSAPQPPFVLAPAQAEYVQKLLTYWESQSGKMQRYRCDFTRFEYDAVTGPPRDANGNMPAKIISYGKLAYAQPDKGLFKVTKITHFTAPQQGQPQASYNAIDGEVGKHWACNGEKIYEVDHKKKQLIEHTLPENARGANIVDGPLPFMFGAKASKINARYWVRVITPKEASAKGEYWLEAFPKSRMDASSFRMVHVILDKTFLPKAIRVFPPNYDANRNPSNTTFVFDKREQNWSMIAQKLQFWQQSTFYEPKLPNGYKKIEVPIQRPGVANSSTATRDRRVIPASGQLPTRRQ